VSRLRADRRPVSAGFALRCQNHGDPEPGGPEPGGPEPGDRVQDGLAQAGLALGDPGPGHHLALATMRDSA
jgi:hypothetical protein